MSFWYIPSIISKKEQNIWLCYYGTSSPFVWIEDTKRTFCNQFLALFPLMLFFAYVCVSEEIPRWIISTVPLTWFLRKYRGFFSSNQNVLGCWVLLTECRLPWLFQNIMGTCNKWPVYSSSNLFFLDLRWKQFKKINGDSHWCDMASTSLRYQHTMFFSSSSSYHPPHLL